jgi:hypothetical protein
MTWPPKQKLERRNGKTFGEKQLMRGHHVSQSRAIVLPLHQLSG